MSPQVGHKINVLGLQVGFAIPNSTKHLQIFFLLQVGFAIQPTCTLLNMLVVGSLNLLLALAMHIYARMEITTPELS